MRKILIGTLLFVIIGLVLFPSCRWLLVNGLHAQNCAESMLNSNSENCDWLNHMVISSDSGSVTFFDHDSEITYIYSPNKLPASIKGMFWQNIYSSWYVGVIKTEQ
jgi:hypothetical protein